MAELVATARLAAHSSQPSALASSGSRQTHPRPGTSVSSALLVPGSRDSLRAPSWSKGPWPRPLL